MSRPRSPRRRRSGEAPPCLGCSGAGGRPTPVGQAQAPTLTRESVVTPRAGLWQAYVDGGLALLDRAAGRATVLNTSAALIFTAFDGERPLHAVVDQLLDETGGDRARISGDVEATVRRLVAAGIVDIDDSDGHLPPGDQEPGDGLSGDQQSADQESGGPGLRGASDPVDGERLAEGGPWAFARDLLVGSATCRLRVEDPSLSAVIGPLVSALPDAPEGDVSHVVSLVVPDRSRPGRHRLVVDGRAGADADGNDLVVLQLLQELDDLAVRGAVDALTFHAGAVARDGRAVLIAGSSGRGKSTLTAALVRHGWSYLTDEVALVRLEDHRIAAYPKALDLDDHSRKLLRIRRAVVDLGADKQKVLPSGLGRVATEATPALVVLLADTGALPERGHAPIERLTPAEGLLALLGATFEHSIDSPERFQALAAWCEQVSIVRMGRARLARCVATVESEAAPVARANRRDGTGS